MGWLVERTRLTAREREAVLGHSERRKEGLVKTRREGVASN